MTAPPKPVSISPAGRMFAYILPALAIGVILGRMWGVAQDDNYYKVKARGAEERAAIYQKMVETLKAERAEIDAALSSSGKNSGNR